MRLSAEDQYIDLLKRALCYTLYDQPEVPVELFWMDRGWIKKRLARVLSSTLGAAGARLSFAVDASEDKIAKGRIWPVAAQTMIGMARMDNLASCVKTVLAEGVPGDLIETGVWRGGACILMKGILAVSGDNERKVFVADSFRGLPKPNEKDYPADAGDKHHTFSSFLAVSRQQVESNFKRYGLLDSRVVFLEGWFKDTLPGLPSERMAVIRLDGDMYESTMDALRSLYPKLSPGGFCIIDDYFLENCKKAVHDYRDSHQIKEPIVEIDGCGVYWRKSR